MDKTIHVVIDELSGGGGGQEALWCRCMGDLHLSDCCRLQSTRSLPSECESVNKLI